MIESGSAPVNPSSLSDRELNEAIAGEMGIVVRGVGEWGSWERAIPAYTTSLDALSEPEQRLRDADLRLFIATNLDGELMAEWVNQRGVQVARADNEKESRARAEAVYVALLALKETAAVLTTEGSNKTQEETA